ncbi:hypothetical protein GE061_016741 [Apolygus lucorum]|uniref:Uncharacterized protein n=1 Tax=Apolygus lucorum TaxID=248454 RepID=A0A8S9XH53_APOLU|nr:hypothetical protein GE061_016741 [Apolygus lucorum]
MRRFNRLSKYEPTVKEVELLEANPEYAFERFPEGHETSISLRHLAPCAEQASESTPPSERPPTPQSSLEAADTPTNDISSVRTLDHPLARLEKNHYLY